MYFGLKKNTKLLHHVYSLMEDFTILLTVYFAPCEH